MLSLRAFEVTLEASSSKYPTPPFETASMTDMVPLRKSVNQTMVDLIVLKKAAKAIGVAKLTNCGPTLSDVHILDVEDFHPTAVSSLRRQTSEPAPPVYEDQLFQILSSMRKQLENQCTKMIRLREAAAHEKKATTCVHTCLLKQIGVQWGSRSSPTAGRNPWDPSPTRTQESAHSTGSSRRVGRRLQRRKGLQGHSEFPNVKVPSD